MPQTSWPLALRYNFTVVGCLLRIPSGANARRVYGTNRLRFATHGGLDFPQSVNELYAQILGIKSPWQVTQVELALSKGEVTVHIEPS